MLKLKIFLCLALFGACANCADEVLQTLSFLQTKQQKALDNLHPKLVATVAQWAAAHPEFPYTFERIDSGDKFLNINFAVP